MALYLRLPVGMATLAKQLATHSSYDSTHCKIVNPAFFTMLMDPYNIQ